MYKGVDEEGAQGSASERRWLVKTVVESFAFVASEPKGRKDKFSVDPFRDYCVNVYGLSEPEWCF